MTHETIHTILQRAKEQALRVDIVTHNERFHAACVLDLDTSSLTILIGARESRQIHVPHVVSATCA